MLSSKNFSNNRLSWAASRALRALPGWITGLFFLGAVVNVLGTALGGLPAWAGTALDLLSNFSAVFLGIVIEAVPFLLLGTLASGFLEVFIDREDLVRWIPRNRFMGVLAGGLVGLFFPVCECGVVPFTRRLMRKGVPVSTGIAVLLAAPVVNPIVIASTLAAFGPGLVFFGRIGLSLTIAVLTGLVFSLGEDPAGFLRDGVIRPSALKGAASDMSVMEIQPPQSLLKKRPGERIRQALLVSVDEFFEMGRFLILGTFLAALMQTIVRQPALMSIGQGPVLSVLVMVILAVLLSVCSTVDAFIALAFLGSFTNGSILAFLVFGPMVDIKSVWMFLRVFKPRPVAYLVLIPLLLTLVFTIFINYFGGGW